MKIILTCLLALTLCCGCTRQDLVDNLKSAETALAQGDATIATLQDQINGLSEQIAEGAKLVEAAKLAGIDNAAVDFLTENAEKAQKLLASASVALDEAKKIRPILEQGVTATREAIENQGDPWYVRTGIVLTAIATAASYFIPQAKIAAGALGVMTNAARGATKGAHALKRIVKEKETNGDADRRRLAMTTSMTDAERDAVDSLRAELRL